MAAPRQEYSGKYQVDNEEAIKTKLRSLITSRDGRAKFWRAMLATRSYEEYESKVGKTVDAGSKKSGHDEIVYARGRGWISGGTARLTPAVNDGPHYDRRPSQRHPDRRLAREALAKMTARAIRKAVREYNVLTQAEFLSRYGYGSAKEYYLVVGGKRYESKAIVGVAAQYLPSIRVPLLSDEFSGGEKQVERLLTRLGFSVVRDVSGGAKQAHPNIQTEIKIVWDAKSGDSEIISLDSREKLSDKVTVKWKPSKRATAISLDVKASFSFDANGIVLRLNYDRTLQKSKSAKKARPGEATIRWTPGDETGTAHWDDFDRNRSVAKEWTGPADSVVVGYTRTGSSKFVDIPNWRDALVEPPAPKDISSSQRKKSRRAVKRDYAITDAKNRQRGKDGEEWVCSWERRRLLSEGKRLLSQRVEIVSETQGDGLGYDVKSFNSDGSDLFIEVKTTTGARDTPFLISHNEISFSVEDPAHFRLYRVFNFDKTPQFYILKGNLEKALHLKAEVYRAFPRGNLARNISSGAKRKHNGGR